MPLDSKLISN